MSPGERSSKGEVAAEGERGEGGRMGEKRTSRTQAYKLKMRALLLENPQATNKELQEVAGIRGGGNQDLIIAETRREAVRAAEKALEQKEDRAEELAAMREEESFRLASIRLSESSALESKLAALERRYFEPNGDLKQFFKAPNKNGDREEILPHIILNGYTDARGKLIAQSQAITGKPASAKAEASAAVPVVAIQVQDGGNIKVGS